MRLATKYARRQREIPAISPDAVEFYSLTGRKDPFPIGCAAEDGTLPGYFDRMATAPLPLKVGEVLLISDDSKGALVGAPVGIDSALMPLVGQIKRYYKLEPLEHDVTAGVWAARLAPPDAVQAGSPMP